MGYVTLGFGMRKKDGRAIVVGMRVFLRRQISKTAHQPAPTISATEVRSSGSGRKRVLVSARESGKTRIVICAGAVQFFGSESASIRVAGRAFARRNNPEQCPGLCLSLMV